MNKWSNFCCRERGAVEKLGPLVISGAGAVHGEPGTFHQPFFIITLFLSGLSVAVLFLKLVGIKCLFAVDDLLDVLLLSLNTPVHVFLTLWDFISVSFSRKCDFFWKIWLILTALTPLSLLPPASSHLLIPPSVSRLSVGALPPSPPPSLCCLRLPAESVSNPALLLRGDPLPFLHLSYSFF